MPRHFGMFGLPLACWLIQSAVPQVIANSAVVDSDMGSLTRFGNEQGVNQVNLNSPIHAQSEPRILGPQLALKSVSAKSCSDLHLATSKFAALSGAGASPHLAIVRQHPAPVRTPLASHPWTAPTLAR